jgi:LCP family protein required for cell wall assembly
MNRINLALPHGHGVDYPGGGGGLIADTILFNFGIEIDHYARIGFDTFKGIVDALDGIEVAVSCTLTDWRLKDPKLDPTIEENWEQFTLESDLYRMDGDLSLWYARSRMSTNDFDRNRRQQQLLEAIFLEGLDLDLLSQIPQLWSSYKDSIETDMNIGQILILASLAPAVRQNGLTHLSFPGDSLQAWRVPITGEAVQLIQWDEAQTTLQQLVQPPALIQGSRTPLKVEVVTGSFHDYRLAADNLAWYGFIPEYVPGTDQPPTISEITYFGTNLKGSFGWLISWLFGAETTDIQLNSVEESKADFRVVLGRNYDPCHAQQEEPPLKPDTSS